MPPPLFDNFKTAVMKVVNTGNACDQVDAEAMRLVVKLYTSLNFDPAFEAADSKNTHAISELVTRHAEASKEQQTKLDLRRKSARKAHVEAGIELYQSMCDASAGDSSRQVYLGAVAARYIAAKSKEAFGNLSGRTLADSGVPFSFNSEAFEFVSNLTGTLARSAYVEGANDPLSASPAPLPQTEWRRAAWALFSLARRQLPDTDASRDLTEGWQAVVERSPSTEQASKLVTAAVTCLNKRPGNSEFSQAVLSKFIKLAMD